MTPRRLDATLTLMERLALDRSLRSVRRQIESLALERLRRPLGPRRQLLYELLCLQEQELLDRLRRAEGEFAGS